MAAQSSDQPASEPYSIHEPSAEVIELGRKVRGLRIALELSADSISRVFDRVRPALSSEHYDTDVIEKHR